MIIAWLLVIRDRLAIICGVSDYLSEYSQTICLSCQDVCDFLVENVVCLKWRATRLAFKQVARRLVGHGAKP